MPEAAATMKALAGLLLPCSSATACTFTPDCTALSIVETVVAPASSSPLDIACRIVAGVANSDSTTFTPARSNQPCVIPSTSAGLLQVRLWPSRTSPGGSVGAAGTVAAAGAIAGAAGAAGALAALCAGGAP